MCFTRLGYYIIFCSDVNQTLPTYVLQAKRITFLVGPLQTNFEG